MLSARCKIHLYLLYILRESQVRWVKNAAESNEYLKGKYVETLYEVYNERLNFYDEIDDHEAPDPTKPSRRTREIHRYQRRIISHEGKNTGFKQKA